jgi:hypothetical protein
VGGQLVADVTVDGEDLPDRGAGTFFFAPVADSADQAFTWALEAPGAGDEATVHIGQAEGRAQGQPAFTAYSTQLQLVDIRKGVWIYRNPNALPRAYVVHRQEVVADQSSLERIGSSEFNPWTTALLEEALPAEAAAAMEDAPLRSSSLARITQYGSHRVTVTTEMAAPGLLVLSDTYYPGWRVSVDGSPADLIRVNYILRGVFLDDGAHEVVFHFAPMVLYVGLASTAAALLGGIGVIWWETRRTAAARSADQRVPEGKGRKGDTL